MSSAVEAQVRSLLLAMATEVDTIVAANSNASGKNDSGMKDLCQDRITADFDFKYLTARISFGGENGKAAYTYAKARVRAMRDAYIQRDSVSSDELKTAAAEFITWLLVMGHAHNPQNRRKTVHHWVPLCYTKNFATRILDNARGAMIWEMRFAHDDSITNAKVVRDKVFAHTSTDGGYYPTGIEDFFSGIESNYSDTLNSKDERNAWSDIVLLAFFATQTARNPDPNLHVQKTFGKSHKARIVQRIFDALDNVESPHIRYVEGCTNLRFSPFMPPRVRQTPDGVKSMVFPLTASKAIVVSDAEVSNSEAERIVAEHSRSLTRHAAREGKPLYGVG